VKKFSKVGVERRKAERSGFSEFYEKHVNLIVENKSSCEECGAKLIGDVSEVAHILPKSTFKSISTLDENVIYLCSWKSQNMCHSKFDGTNKQLWGMKIFENIKLRVPKLLETVTENYNWKLTDKWKLD